MPYPDASFVVVDHIDGDKTATLSLHIDGVFEEKVVRSVDELPEEVTRGDVVAVEVADGCVEIGDEVDAGLTRAYYDSLLDVL